MSDTTTITPWHQWTHTGDEVLIVKCVPRDGRVTGTANGRAYQFVWPLTVGARVDAPDWNPTPECGGGLHGWPWGFALGDGKAPDWTETWIVFGARPEDVVSIDGGKVKARVGIVRYVGDWIGATMHVLDGQIAWVQHAASGAASATGWGGAASATGESGAASATGESGAASATGECSLAGVTGLDGRAQAGPYGCIALAWLNNSRAEMRCAEVGCGDGTDGKLKSGVWYRLDGVGQFVEC